MCVCVCARARTHTHSVYAYVLHHGKFSIDLMSNEAERNIVFSGNVHGVSLIAALSLLHLEQNSLPKGDQFCYLPL